MGTASLARKLNETFDAVGETESVLTPVEYKIASDDDVKAASSYVLAEHIEAYKELARYDSN
jgi:hypothetical protein